MIKQMACLFDLDGVIIDTAKYHFQAWRELADELGFTFTEIDNERLKGVSRMQSLDILLSIGNLHLDNVRKVKLAEKKNSRYRQLVLQMRSNETIPGAIDCLKSCHEYGIKIGLASASKNTHDILRHMGLETFFDAVVDGNDVVRTKPDPEVFLTAADRLRVHPQGCIVFEDSVAGIVAARNAEMFSVGIGDSRTLGSANIVVRSLSEIEIPKLLKTVSAVPQA